MSLIEEINKRLKSPELKFIDKVIHKDKINLLYKFYNSEEDRELTRILDSCCKSEKIQISMSGCSNKELSEIYGFDKLKDYENLFKNKGLDIIAINFCK